jgi:hypothetical protein
MYSWQRNDFYTYLHVRTQKNGFFLQKLSPSLYLPNGKLKSATPETYTGTNLQVLLFASLKPVNQSRHSSCISKSTWTEVLVCG